MQRILAACGNDLNRLGKWEVRDFSRFKGMGPAKSITVMASLELGKRRKLQERSDVPPSALPPTSTSCSIPCSATLPQKNSGYCL